MAVVPGHSYSAFGAMVLVLSILSSMVSMNVVVADCITCIECDLTKERCLIVQLLRTAVIVRHLPSGVQFGI